MVGIVIVLILIILEVLYELVNVESFNKLCGVLILIILEVLYEIMQGAITAWDTAVLILIILEVLYEPDFENHDSLMITNVLILIILEVLYERYKYYEKYYCCVGLNPYYTGSTLWEP